MDPQDRQVRPGLRAPLLLSPDLRDLPDPPGRPERRDLLGRRVFRESRATLDLRDQRDRKATPGLLDRLVQRPPLPDRLDLRVLQVRRE